MITGTITAEGITLTHKTPALALCRALIAAGLPDQPMTVCRDGTPSMLIASIVGAATLTVIENEKVGPRFGKWKAFAGFNGDAPDGLEPSEAPDLPDNR
jgi:hypothetical protein